MKGYKAIIYFLIALLIACGTPTGEKVKDTTTSGHINIGADEEYKLITEAEVNAFQDLYFNSSLHCVFANEDSAFSLLLKDSVRLIVAGRKLTSSEEAYFNGKQLHPDQFKIGTDALVLVVNNNNPDTLLSLDKLKAIFGGQDSLWKQVNNKSALGKINIVFDHENSSNSRYIQQNLVQNKKFPSYCFALHNNREVIDYVSKNEAAIGVIGLNCVSNGYDTTAENFLKRVKVVAIASSETAEPSNYYKPWQTNMEMGQYPLCRDIYIISREAYAGLGSGFLSFVTSNKGQRVIFREGLLPLKMPSHTIHF